MHTSFLRRPGIAATVAGLEAALTRLRVHEETAAVPLARWQHSYALREAGGSFGLACLAAAESADAIRRHAECTAVSLAEQHPVVATLVERAFAPTRVFLIRRRSFWPTLAELDDTAAAARRVGAQMATEVSWLRTYVVRENDGLLGTVCLYQSVAPEALVRHAARVGMPADEIVPVIDRIVYRPDPQEQRVRAATMPA